MMTDFWEVFFVYKVEVKDNQKGLVTNILQKEIFCVYQ